jgi:hypothetical protein
MRGGHLCMHSCVRCACAQALMLVCATLLHAHGMFTQRIHTTEKPALTLYIMCAPYQWECVVRGRVRPSLCMRAMHAGAFSTGSCLSIVPM